jgi:oligopeptide/dipeptide ABC transporter ATP-binding protein
MTLLEVENLSVTFPIDGGRMTVVEDVSFSVDKGTTLCVVGESGSGKSVTGLAVMRLLDSSATVGQESEVRFQGKNLLALGEREMQRVRGTKIAMIFQEPMTALNPVYTVGYQVAEVVRQHQGVSRKVASERVVELLELVGIPDSKSRMSDYPHQMSGGMRQRVMIAMALAGGPDLLIADEPTTALDVTIQAQILDLLKSLQERLQMGLILITHDFGVVAEIADDVAVMYAGQIVERGPAGAVLGVPQMPYTEALLKSMPVLGLDRKEPLKVIRGIVPNPAEWPTGCRFRPRCDYAFDKCTVEPPAFAVEEQRSKCWLCEHGPRPTGGNEGGRPERASQGEMREAGGRNER